MIKKGSQVTGPFAGTWTVVEVDKSKDGKIKNRLALCQHPDGPYNAANPIERRQRWFHFSELQEV